MANSVPNPSASEREAIAGAIGSAEPTDNSPTVISKPPAAGKTEDQFSGSLRGRRLAHFELIEPIGIGGMAAVLRARDTQLDRVVALKILPPEMASDAENIRRFHQEARNAAKLDHDNIARAFFCGEDQRLHFIAFEFVEGENLRTILDQRGRLPIAEALRYLLQLTTGLAHASRRGVVHRDIKPSNIIITPEGRAKLVDMGLARSLEPRHDAALTQSGVTLGTFDYISPEQALEPRDADVRSDIYSLGCTFYHVLTGQAPVPEGTAAKKLHHQQHVKPIDPRQLVPDLPDEAAIILDRMMAKQPRDRYQSAEELLHHLLLLARKLGVEAEMPAGISDGEAILPRPPAGRSLLLAGLAAAAVIVLILILDQPTIPKGDTIADGRAATVREKEPKPPLDDPSSVPAHRIAAAHKQLISRLPDNRGSSGPAAQAPPTYRPDAPTAAGLLQFLKDNRNAPEIIIELSGDLDLSESVGGEGGLLLANRKLMIRAAKSATGSMPTIFYDYHQKSTQPIQAPLTIQGDECRIEGIRFVLYKRGADVPMAAVMLQDVRKASIQRCLFIQAHPTVSESNRMASVLIESKNPALLELNESCFLGFASLTQKEQSKDKSKIRAEPFRFLPSEWTFDGAASGGQDAVTRRGPVRIEAGNCLFGPHAAAFRLEGAASETDRRTRIAHCSVLSASQSAVFVAADGADARIDCSYSLFSHPGDPSMTGMAEGQGVVLLRQTVGPGSVNFHGRQNRYHQLDHYWSIVNDRGEVVRQRDTDMNDESSNVLERSPWKAAQPLKLLLALAVREAFQVDLLQTELRPPAADRPRGGQLIGDERALAFSYVTSLPSLADGGTPPDARELVVEKREKVDPDKRLYPSLRHAVDDARAGDVIRLNLDGEVKLDPLVLRGSGLSDLTIRAGRGFHPILTLGNTEEVDAALFRVHNGKLLLHNLEIRLRPSGEALESQAVVSFVGDGECTLKDCLITLDRGGRKTALAVAVLTEPGKLMKKSEQPPRLRVENCFLRGQGDLIWSRGGQAAEVAIDNSLIALTGSLLDVESGKDAAAGALMIQLNRVTTYLGGHLFYARAGKNLKGLPMIQCEPANCLFLPSSSDRALVRLEGMESEQRGLADKWAWRGNSSAFGNFNTLLETQAIGAMDTMMPQLLSSEDWKSFSGEMDGPYGVKLLRSPAANVSFTQLVPSAFKTDDKAKGRGADLASLHRLAPRREESDVPFPGFGLSDSEGDE